MNISLTDELEEYVSKQVQTGYYKSASEVIREALRNQIQRSMEEKLDHRISVARQQVEDGKIFLANDDYFEAKRKMIKEKYRV
jgi:antitoxin ParD1/3/4